MYYDRKQKSGLPGLSGHHHHGHGHSVVYQPIQPYWPYPYFYDGFDTTAADFIQGTTCQQRKSTGEWVKLVNGEYQLCGPSLKPKPMGLMGLADFDAWQAYLVKTGQSKSPGREQTQEQADAAARVAEMNASRGSRTGGSWGGGGSQTLPGLPDNVVAIDRREGGGYKVIDTPITSQEEGEAIHAANVAVTDERRAIASQYQDIFAGAPSHEELRQATGLQSQGCSDPTYAYYHPEECRGA